MLVILSCSGSMAVLLPAEGHAQASYAASYYAAQRAESALAVPAYPTAGIWPQEPAEAPSYQQKMAAYRPPSPAQTALSAIPVARPGSLVMLRFDGEYATPSVALPIQVQYAVNAANYLQHKPYVLGGGHRSIEDSAYDCSSAVSYALIKGGMLRGPLTSTNFAKFGAPGPGRFITIWVKPGHVFMTVCGLRLDTTGGAPREGPRWRMETRSFAGFTPRHPVGL
jgi:hypothetical protein